MNNCYVVLRNIPNLANPSNVSTDLAGVTDRLYLAEKLISEYYTENFGVSGGRLLCLYAPQDFGDVRRYWMEDNYKKDGATFFTVQEIGINDDSALI